jgi:hypothetical protein
LHIGDVQEGLLFLAKKLLAAAAKHDHTKLSKLDDFWADFITGFEQNGWWKMHQKEERHHFNSPEYVREDVNLVDVLEQIVDGVMAGLARSGTYRNEPVSNELLQKAYANTARLLIRNVEVLGEEGASVYSRGVTDAAHDSFENCPFGSVGGLDKRGDMKAPAYIPKAEAEDYLAGYRRGALQLYGMNWETCAFGWKPTMEIVAGVKP